jgi:hypothetical protein
MKGEVDVDCPPVEGVVPERAAHRDDVANGMSTITMLMKTLITKKKDTFPKAFARVHDFERIRVQTTGGIVVPKRMQRPV